MDALKLLAKITYVLTLFGSLVVLAYFMALILGLITQQNGFWSENSSKSAIALLSSAM